MPGGQGSERKSVTDDFALVLNADSSSLKFGLAAGSDRISQVLINGETGKLACEIDFTG